MESTTRAQVLGKIGDYLQHRIRLPELVEWAEQVMMEGDFAPDDYDELRDVVARLVVADVRAFGLTWEECEELVGRLGYRVEVTLHPSNGGGTPLPE